MRPILRYEEGWTGHLGHNQHQQLRQQQQQQQPPPQQLYFDSGMKAQIRSIYRSLKIVCMISICASFLPCYVRVIYFLFCFINHTCKLVKNLAMRPQWKINWMSSIEMLSLSFQIPKTVHTRPWLRIRSDSVFLPGSGFQISLLPDPVSAPGSRSKKKECRKGSKIFLLDENLKIMTKDRQK